MIVHERGSSARSADGALELEHLLTTDTLETVPFHRIPAGPRHAPCAMPKQKLRRGLPPSTRGVTYRRPRHGSGRRRIRRAANRCVNWMK
jgi:hypothetical protein